MANHLRILFLFLFMAGCSTKNLPEPTLPSTKAETSSTSQPTPRVPPGESLPSLKDLSGIQGPQFSFPDAEFSRSDSFVMHKTSITVVDLATSKEVLIKVPDDDIIDIPGARCQYTNTIIGNKIIALKLECRILTVPDLKFIVGSFCDRLESGDDATVMSAVNTKTHSFFVKMECTTMERENKLHTL